MIIIQNQVCFPLILRFLNLNCDSFLHFLVRERRTSLCVVVWWKKGKKVKRQRELFWQCCCFKNLCLWFVVFDNTGNFFVSCVFCVFVSVCVSRIYLVGMHTDLSELVPLHLHTQQT